VIRDDSPLLEAIAEARVPATGLTRRSGFIGTIIRGNKKVVQQITGVEWVRDTFTKDRLTILEGSLDAMSNPRGIVISKRAADKLGARLGDTLTIQLKTVTDQANVGDFEVAAISHDPGFSYSFAAYAGLPYVNSLINIREGEYQTMGILLEDAGAMDADADRAYRALSGRVAMLDRDSKRREANPLRAMLRQHEQNPGAAMFQTLVKQAGDEPWTGTRYRLYTIDDILSQAQLPMVISMINGLAFIVLLVLFGIIVVGVTNTFRIILAERSREIGTMRALGMKRGAVRNLFLLEAILLFLGGTCTGLGAAALGMGALKLVNFGSGMFAMMLEGGRMSFAVPVAQTVIQILTVGFLTVLAALLPAHRAARLSPAKALASVT
jgi:putative ABC transport system permease protein